jgi:putative ABC transport system ATP-binding protein
MLELCDLVKLYPVGEGDPVHAVDGVSLTVAAGELVALYGPSGSGKTTLLMMAAALLAPDSGAVLVDGRKISSLSAAQSARYRLHELGYVRQSLELIPGASAGQRCAEAVGGGRHSARGHTRGGAAA